MYFEQLASKKPLISYSNEILKNIQILHAFKDDKIIPFGSATYRIQKFPGDLDLREDFVECCSSEEVLNKFTFILQRLVEKLFHMSKHYVTEVKAGIDYRYDVDIGECVNGVYTIPKNQLGSLSYDYHQRGLLNDEEYSDIINILNEPKNNGDDYDLMKFIWREKKILRWTAPEIILGKKQLPMNKETTLREAMEAKTDVKIDTISLISGRYVEVTNYFTLGYLDPVSGLPMAINFTENVLDQKVSMQRYDHQLRDEIEKLYYSDLYYSPFKMVKRMWAYSRFFKMEKAVKDLTPLVSGDLSLGYSLTSELEAIMNVIEYEHNKNKHINKMLDSIKYKISNVLPITDADLLVIANKINEIKAINNPMSLLSQLKYLKGYIKDRINSRTIHELSKIGYNPPPKQFLPKKMTYK